MIGVKFTNEIPKNVPKIKYKDKYCHFIGKAKTNAAFYIEKENISCPLAKFYLGIGNTNLKSLADTLVSWSDAVDKEVGLSYLESAVRMDESKNYIVFFSYPFESITPNVIMKIVNPDKAQTVIQRYSASTGKRISSSFSGIGAACGECTALPVVEGTPNVSIGCNGSRPGIGLKENELLIAAPFNSKIIDFL